MLRGHEIKGELALIQAKLLLPLSVDVCTITVRIVVLKCLLLIFNCCCYCCYYIN